VTTQQAELALERTALLDAAAVTLLTSTLGLLCVCSGHGEDEPLLFKGKDFAHTDVRRVAM